MERFTPAPPPPSPRDDAAPAAETPEAIAAQKPAPHPEPTRYGDWEMLGKCVDF